MTQNLPTNSEVGTGAQVYRELYFRDDHPSFAALRREALNVCGNWLRYRPIWSARYLSGSAALFWTSTCIVYSDNAKGRTLSAQPASPQHVPSRSEQTSLLRQFYSNDTPVTVTVSGKRHPPQYRQNPRNGQLERARIEQVQQLLEQ